MTELSAPSTAPATHPLVARIVQLRARVRTVIALFGVGAVISAAVGGLFALMLADYLVHLPQALRLLLLLGWVVLAGVLIWKLLIAPLSTRLTDQFLASRVENVNRQLADELMSAVQFIHSRAAATNALAARHIDQTARNTANIRFEDAVDFRQAGKSLGVAGLVIAVVAIIGALNPLLTRIAFSRWFSASPIAWPHTTHVSFDWSAYAGKEGAGGPPKVFPLGEKMAVRAKVDQGSLPRVWLYNWTDKDSSTASTLMTYQKEQSSGGVYIFESALQPDGKQLSLRLEAGDDTEEPPVTIQLAPRPVITELFAAITPPPYVKNIQDPAKPAPAVVVDLLSQAGRAVEGSTVSLRIRATKPFLVDANNQPVLRFVDMNKDEEIPLAMGRRLLEPNLAEITFKATKTLQARLMMRDTDTFENRVGGTVTLQVVPDALPSIVITEPRRSVDRAPTAFVEISLQATDDLGLDGLKLRADKFDAKPGDPALFESPLQWSEQSADSSVGSTTGKSKYTWDLTPLNLQPGARLTFYAMVQDNYEVDGVRHEWVKSAPLSLQIRSAAEIAEAARRNLTEVKERITNLKGQQEQTRSLTDAIRKAVDASGVSTPQQKSQLADLAQQQNQEAASGNSIQQRTDQIADDLRQNKMGEGDLGKLAQEVAAGMQSVGQENMPKAAGDLNKAQESAGNHNPDPDAAKGEAKQAANAMASANGQQDQAIATMDALINRLASASDFEALRARVNNLLSQQQQVANQTKQLAAQTIGRNPQDLPRELQDKLAALAKQQDDLHNQTADTIDQMNKTAQQLTSTDPASSQSLQSAAQAGTQANVSNAQSTASSSIGSNQLSDAANSQSQAQRGLQQMADELNKNDRRQLEQLARQLRALLDEVKKLKADEEALNKDTVAAGPTAASGPMQKLGDRQGTLQQNTIVVQKKAENTPRAKDAAADIHDAADAMSSAAGALYASKQADSLDPETKAIAALDAAIKKLDQAAARTEAESKDKDLAAYIKEYEAIQKDQSAVKATTDAIEKRRQAAVDKEVDRPGTFKLAELASTQSGLSDRVNQLSTDDKLKAYDVIVWMNSQVTELMAVSQERLTKIQLGPQIASAQQGSIDRLQLIIDALKEEQKRNSDFQKPSGGGGGGGKQPLVPPLAQLKMLKAMQVVVNGQTSAVNTGLSTAASDADKNEYQTEAQKLGQKQGEIRGIADKLTKQLSQ